jgi:hypothetical protein
MAAHGENQPSQKENPYHTKMFPDTPKSFYIFIICGLCQPYPDLADVIRHKGRSHRYPFGLPERIVLHRADKIDQHLHNLHRDRQRQKSNQEQDKHLKSH